jgi:AcrR family transcriptional regulator
VAVVAVTRTDGGGEAPRTRRDRLRAAAVTEIATTARRLLSEGGPDAVSLSAIAREMGIQVPGLYRYFSGYPALIRHLIADIYAELAADVATAMDAAAASPLGPGDEADQDEADQDAGRFGAQLIAAAREFRRWARSRPAEFRLVFGAPLPGMPKRPTLTAGQDLDRTNQQAVGFVAVMFKAFAQLCERHRFPVPEPDVFGSGLGAQLAGYAEVIGSSVPPGAMLAFLWCLEIIYGAVMVEASGHLDFALDEPAALFECTLADMAATLGLRYTPATGLAPAEVFSAWDLIATDRDWGAAYAPVPLPAPRSRRERMRATTVDEIVATARELLAREGPAAVSLRAIAREMGLTAPALYNYFASHDELIRHVLAGIFAELTDEVQRAVQASAVAGDPAVTLAAACRQFRGWAIGHPAEFTLVFSFPLPRAGTADDPCSERALRFAATYFGVFMRATEGHAPPVPALTFVRCWVLLYGAVAMETFGLLNFAFEDPAPMFELTISRLAGHLGLRYPVT